ncbi:c-type cytochrome [Salinimonas chungwhensis]|uniref:c-type cytochrome n=1 Tax=Salinimonas chungwhensis TaxID=265425 RepID=UPI00036DD61E|nr:c-type cytochrome [Salinimonas chungwhensis]
MKVKSWLVAGAMTLAAVAQAQEMSDEAIKERIKPVGSVNIGGNDAQGAAAGGGGGGTRSGEAVYNNACVACHGAGVLGAPKHQVAADWQPRLDERGFDMLLQNAINGYNAMPPRGTCGDCSDDEIKAAIEYMMEGI